MARLIFLDLDGVICCNMHGELERPKLAEVRRIVDATGAKVVMSSDWRRRPELKQRAEVTLASAGVEVIGATPQYAMYSRVRPKEILAWLREFREPVAGWVAIDDRDLVLEEGGKPDFVGHFVLTEFHSGLTPDLADQAIARIRNEPISRRATAAATNATRNSVARPSMPASTPASSGSSSPGSLATPPAAVGAAGKASKLSSLPALLRDSSLSHLEPFLGGETLHSLLELLHDEAGGRVVLLGHLRARGVARIGDRQAVANALGRALRLGRIDTADEEAKEPDDDEPKATGAEVAAATAVAADAPRQLRGSFYAVGAPAHVGEGSDVPTTEPLGSGLDAYVAPVASPPLDSSASATADASRVVGSVMEKKATRPATRRPPAREQSVRIVDAGGSTTHGLMAIEPDAPCAAVICHPHPSRGGDMYNAFVASAFLLLSSQGISTLRFNFTDEVDDPDDVSQLMARNRAEAAGALRLLRERSPPGLPVVLIGYSWGAIVGLSAARDAPGDVQVRIRTRACCACVGSCSCARCAHASAHASAHARACAVMRMLMACRPSPSSRRPSTRCRRRWCRAAETLRAGPSFSRRARKTSTARPASSAPSPAAAPPRWWSSRVSLTSCTATPRSRWARTSPSGLARSPSDVLKGTHTQRQTETLRHAERRRGAVRRWHIQHDHVSRPCGL